MLGAVHQESGKGLGPRRVFLQLMLNPPHKWMWWQSGDPPPPTHLSAKGAFHIQPNIGCPIDTLDVEDLAHQVSHQENWEFFGELQVLVRHSEPSEASAIFSGGGL